MYKFALTFFLCLIIQSAFGQIPNAGFESWTNGNPNGWYTTNVVVTTITQSTTVHSGSLALRGDVEAYFTYIMPPSIQTGQDARGFAYNQRPVSITGYYQFFPAASSGDRFYVDAVLYKGGVDGTGVAVGAVAISAAASTYTQFTATFNYLTSDIPDTCVIQISIVGSGTGVQATPHVGSYYLLDDLAFSGSTDVENQSSLVPVEMNLKQNYPNPFNPSTTISYSLSKASYVKLHVFNILGKELATLADGFQSAGNHSVHFLASNMASGVYFYRLEAEGYTSMKQMLLVK
jgi:Secretion system C-terminal sorting domain